ncbi:MAG: hypothetical protein R3B40_05690 [Polyangiales bacterium]
MTRTRNTLALVCAAAILVLGCADDGAPSTTLSVGAEGGALRAGGVTVTVPAGALTETTELTLSRLSQREVTALAADVQFTGMPFELAPLATVFAAGVSVNLPYSGADDDLFVLFAAGPTDPWQIVAGASFADGAATFNVTSGGVFVVVRAFATQLPELSTTPTFAVVSSDYSSTSIAMLDAAGDPLVTEWFTSADALAGLVAALGGDVSLPTMPEPGHITVIDRLRVDVLTRVAIPGGELVGQLRTHATGGAAGFSSNPQDYVSVSGTSAWVTRFEQNADPNAVPAERGTDLIEIDPTTMTRTGERVDLSSFNTTVDENPVLARPSRMVRLGSYVAVGLGLLSADFGASADGVVVLVDPSAGTFSSLTLTGLRNCGTLVPVPGDATRAVVACTGHSGTFDAAEVRATAGVVVVQQVADGLVEDDRWEAGADALAAVAVNGIVALSADEFVAVEYGDFIAPTDDAVYRVRISTGAQEQLGTASGQYVMGTSAYDADSGLLLVPDASAGLRRFTLEAAAATEGAPVPLSMARGLAPRHAALVGR